MHRIAVLLALLGGTLAAGPALAQLGAIFGDLPPRPPANVPNGSFPPQPPPVRYSPQSLPPPPAQYPPQSSSAPDRYPAQALPPPAAAAGPPPSGIQAQPLPPPPGATSAPAVSNRVIAPQTGSLDSSNQTIVPQQSAARSGRGPWVAGGQSAAATGGHCTPARRHRDHRNADAKDRELTRGIFRAGQDHGPHHQLRCGNWRNGTVRRAAGDCAGLLHAPADRSDQY